MSYLVDTKSVVFAKLFGEREERKGEREARKQGRVAEKEKTEEGSVEESMLSALTV